MDAEATREGIDWERAKETFLGDKNVPQFECSSGYMGIQTCQNSGFDCTNCTLKVHAFYCM